MYVNGEILYVLSDVRSGSTLLDQLLGAHPSIFSVGELHWLAAYVREDRSIYNPSIRWFAPVGGPCLNVRSGTKFLL